VHVPHWDEESRYEELALGKAKRPEADLRGDRLVAPLRDQIRVNAGLRLEAKPMGL
jgi:hypothetical protein